VIRTVVFNDGSYIVGERKWWYAFAEPWSGYIYKVLEGSEEFKSYIGWRLLIRTNAIKFVDIDSKK